MNETTKVLHTHVHLSKGKDQFQKKKLKQQSKLFSLLSEIANDFQSAATMYGKGKLNISENLQKISFSRSQRPHFLFL